MGDIYRLASGVVALLGPEADGSRLALRLIEKVGGVGMIEVNFLSGRVEPSTMGRDCGELGWARHAAAPIV